jgi:type IV fimbrial biogenesis protein FimT
MRAQWIGGYTLIELLFTLAIACILSLLGISGMHSLTAKTHNNLALQTTITTLDRARSLAVTRGKRVGVCMLTTDGTCSADWIGNDLAVFVDLNQNRQRDSNEDIIYRTPWPSTEIQLQWSNWRQEPLVTYKPDGAVASNGTLTFFDKKNQPIEAIVISKPGRARIQQSL